MARLQTFVMVPYDRQQEHPLLPADTAKKIWILHHGYHVAWHYENMSFSDVDALADFKTLFTSFPVNVNPVARINDPRTFHEKFSEETIKLARSIAKSLDRMLNPELVHIAVDEQIGRLLLTHRATHGGPPILGDGWGFPVVNSQDRIVHQNGGPVLITGSMTPQEEALAAPPPLNTAGITYESEL